MSSRKEARNAALGLGLSGAAAKDELTSVNPAQAKPEPAAEERAASRAPPEPRPRLVSGAVGAVSRTLGQFRHELKAAQDMVASGSQVIEIDTAEIDESILKDRMEVDAEQQSILVESIRHSGQQSPVLVRRVAEAPVRYQLAYGHRRVAACRELGRKVLAIVRPLSDQELLVAQGQENSSRADLSYIERATFAHNLELRGISRETIMLALATEKTELSRMISVARTVPAEIVSAVGPAPKTGRTRWLALAERLGDRKNIPRVRALLEGSQFRSAPSDKRFELLFKFLQARPKDRPRDVWANAEGKVLVHCVRSAKATTLSIDEKLEPGFGEYLFAQLDAIYAGFRDKKGEPE